MKHSILSVIVGTLLFLTVSLGYSQTLQPKDSTSIAHPTLVKLPFAGAYLGFYGIAIERAITKRLSVQLYLDRLDAHFKENDHVSAHIRGFAIIPEIRYYLGPNRNEMQRGFFVAAYFPWRAASYDLTATTSDKNGTPGNKIIHPGFHFMGAGICLGRRFPIVKNRVSVEYWAGTAWGNNKGAFPTSVEVDITNSSGSATSVPIKIPREVGVLFTSTLRLGLSVNFHF